ELPDLVPLVDIGHAGRGQLEKRLRQAVEQPEAPHAALEIDEVAEEQVAVARLERAAHELQQRFLVGRIGLGPAGAQFRLARRLDRSEEHTSELQSLAYLVCRLLL